MSGRSISIMLDVQKNHTLFNPSSNSACLRRLRVVREHPARRKASTVQEGRRALGLGLNGSLTTRRFPLLTARPLLGDLVAQPLLRNLGGERRG